MMHNFEVGTKLRVINAGYGAQGADGLVGIVVKEDCGINTSGLLITDKNTFNIKSDSGRVWRVSKEGIFDVIKHVVVKLPLTNVHYYEHLPYTLNTVVRNGNDEIFQTQQIQRDSSKYKVIYNGRTTIVIMDDGSKGIAKCDPLDKYSLQKGHDIAKMRANIAKLHKEIEKVSKQ